MFGRPLEKSIRIQLLMFALVTFLLEIARQIFRIFQHRAFLVLVETQPQESGASNLYEGWSQIATNIEIIALPLCGFLVLILCYQMLMRRLPVGILTVTLFGTYAVCFLCGWLLSIILHDESASFIGMVPTAFLRSVFLFAGALLVYAASRGYHRRLEQQLQKGANECVQL